MYLSEYIQMAEWRRSTSIQKASQLSKQVNKFNDFSLNALVFPANSPSLIPIAF